MYTRRNRCLPTFHSTSTISRPSERATRSAAPRIFSKSTQRLPDLSRSAVHSNRPNKKVGSRPLIRSTRFRAKSEYIPAARQKQDTGPPSSDFGTTEDAGERSGDLGRISRALAGCNRRGGFSDRSVTYSLPPH